MHNNFTASEDVKASELRYMYADGMKFNLSRPPE